jgi:hypothetical protein
MAHETMGCIRPSGERVQRRKDRAPRGTPIFRGLLEQEESSKKNGRKLVRYGKNHTSMVS